MLTLAEKLKDTETQSAILGDIVANLRESGEWGQRGLFAKIATATALSPAYVGSVLSGRKPITETFLTKMTVYMGWSLDVSHGTQGKSSGKTLARAIELLREAVAEKGQRGVSRGSGIALLSIQRYLKGDTEITAVNLQRLADYFNETFIIEIRPRGK